MHTHASRKAPCGARPPFGRQQPVDQHSLPQDHQPQGHTVRSTHTRACPWSGLGPACPPCSPSFARKLPTNRAPTTCMHAAAGRSHCSICGMQVQHQVCMHGMTHAHEGKAHHPSTPVAPTPPSCWAAPKVRQAAAGPAACACTSWLGPVPCGPLASAASPLYGTCSSACTRSLHTSSTSSMPMLNRMRFSLMPISARFSGPKPQYDCTAGISMRLSTPPSEGAM